jgi:ketosteroid isomerase-like protein
MKRIAFAVGLVVLVLGVAILAKTQTGSVEQEIMKLVNGWNKSVIKLDVSFMEQILADDYTWTDPAGKIHSKAEEIASMKSEEGLVTSAIDDEVKIRVYGDAAVVTGRTIAKWKAEGKEGTNQIRWTDTWIKRDGRWQCVADHVSNVPQK